MSPRRHALPDPGDRYGRLTVVEVCAGMQPRRIRCICSCGRETLIRFPELYMGKTKSCGCLRDEFLKRPEARHIKHGDSKSPTYNIWASMHQRCNPTKGHKDYAGRGIKVCPRWRDYSTFLEDMGKAPKGRSLDRIDNDGDYEPSNCRWATTKQQSMNKRNTLRFEDFPGGLEELAKKSGIIYSTLWYRMKRGWSFEKATTFPVRKNHRQASSLLKP